MCAMLLVLVIICPRVRLVAGIGRLRYLPWGSKIVCLSVWVMELRTGLSRRKIIGDRLSKGPDCPVLLLCSFLFWVRSYVPDVSNLFRSDG